MRYNRIRQIVIQCTLFHAFSTVRSNGYLLMVDVFPLKLTSRATVEIFFVSLFRNICIASRDVKNSHFFPYFHLFFSKNLFFSTLTAHAPFADCTAPVVPVLTRLTRFLLPLTPWCKGQAEVTLS